MYIYHIIYVTDVVLTCVCPSTTIPSQRYLVEFLLGTDLISAFRASLTPLGRPRSDLLFPFLRLQVQWSTLQARIHLCERRACPLMVLSTCLRMEGASQCPLKYFPNPSTRVCGLPRFAALCITSCQRTIFICASLARAVQIMPPIIAEAALRRGSAMMSH